MKKKLNITKIKSLLKKEKFSKVIKMCRTAIKSKSSLRDSYAFLARSYTETEQYRESLQVCDFYICLGKNNRLIFKEKAYLYYKQKEYDKALNFALMVEESHSTDVELLGILAKSYLEVKEYRKSLEIFIKLQKQLPPNKGPYYDIGVCLQELGREKEAFWQYLNQLKYNNSDLKALLKFGHLADKSGNFKYALVAYHKLLDSMPQHKDKLNMGIGGCHLNLGNVREAINYFKLVSACDWTNHCATLLSYHYDYQYKSEFIYKEHYLWASQYVSDNSKKTWSNSNKKIKIGFVSPDFRNHPVSYFLMPIFEYLDRNKFEIFCFSNVLEKTELTKIIKERDDLRYIDILNLNTDEIISLIEEQQIDILIDLAGHTASSRLDVMRQKAAPIQMTYLGYPDTTGLSQIDYRITDHYADPPKLTDPYCSEQLLRLPHCFLSFEPPVYCPDVSELPYKKNGFITFGSFNKITKVSHHTIVLWAFILKRIPASKLVLKSRGLVGDVGELTLCRFEKQGIDRSRITILPLSMTHEGHFAQYSEIDIALDSYPYNGTTTTFEALWMGRPVISRAGENHVSRVSASILQNSNMSELVVESDIEYIDVAEKLSNNLELLDKVSATLRPRMVNLGLVDGKGFVRDFEIALETAWDTYLRKADNDWHGERVYHPCGFHLYIRNNYIPELTMAKYDYCLCLEKVITAAGGCLDIGFIDIESSLTIAKGLGESGRYLVVEDDTEITDYILENVNGNLLNNTLCTAILDRNVVGEQFANGCEMIRINASQYFTEILEEIFDLITRNKPMIQLNIKNLQVDIKEIVLAFKDTGYQPHIVRGENIVSAALNDDLKEEPFIILKATS